MKKAIIAAGASAVLAAMPVVGTFAANYTTISDQVSGTLDMSCSMTNDASTANNGTNTLTTGTLTAGSDTQITGSAFTVHCNSYENGWSVTAIGAGENTGTSESPVLTAMKGIKNTSTPIATATSGTNQSYWYMTVTGDNILNSFSSAHVIPAVATEVAGVTGGSAGAATDSNGANFTAAYTIHTDYNQQADTYTGKVTYTLVSPYTSTGA